MTTIPIDVCCNDPDNGLFAARAEQIQILDLIELSARRDPAPRFREVDDCFALAGKHWRVMHSKEWFGNWCWNRYWLELNDAVMFVVWLHRRRLFICDQAEARIFNIWRKADRFTIPDAEFLQRELAKAPLGLGRL